MDKKILFLTLIPLLLSVIVVPVKAVGPKNSFGKNPNVHVTTNAGTETILYPDIGIYPPPHYVLWNETKDAPMDAMGSYDMFMHYVYRMSADGAEIFISYSMSMHEKLYDIDGNDIGVMEMSLSYRGTFDSSTYEYENGKLVTGWRINLKTELPLPSGSTLKGHYVVWYEGGEVVKWVGFGTPMFTIQGYPFP